MGDNMTLDEFIAELEEIRDSGPDHGDVPILIQYGSTGEPTVETRWTADKNSPTRTLRKVLLT